MDPIARLALSAALFALASCGTGGARAPAQVVTYGDVTISDARTWANQQVTVTGTLTIAAAGSLTLDNTTLLFAPAIQDTDAFVVQGGALTVKNNSAIRSGNGKQWNLQAHGPCHIAFQGSLATNHSGLRMYDGCSFVADGGNVEEAQVHDNATVAIRNGAQAYLVLFFTGAGSTTTLNNGELVSGAGLTRSFDVATGTGTTGHVVLNNATVSGFQLDLVNSVTLNVAGGTGIVLAMHLNNVGDGAHPVVNGASLTSSASASGSLDFSGYSNPKVVFTNTQISSFNVYLTGTSNVSFTGVLNVTEPDAQDSSILTFGAGASVYANLAMTHQSAQMILNGSTLLDPGGAFPSFTALDQSVIRLNQVNALPDARVQSVGQGQVQITGGAGWSQSQFEVTNPVPPGGIFVH